MTHLKFQIILYLFVIMFFLVLSILVKLHSFHDFIVKLILILYLILEKLLF